MLIIWEPLIIRESVSGRSWTSKVFNTVISLDTYQFFFVHFIWKKNLVRKWQTNLNMKRQLFFPICKLIFFAFSNFAILEKMASAKLSSCKSKTAKTDDLLNIYHEGSSSVSCLDTTYSSTPTYALNFAQKT